MRKTMGKKTEKKILTLADVLKDEVVGFVREIVAIPSPSGQEGTVVERLMQEMKRIGYDEVRVDPMGNLLGRMGSGLKIVAIDGHCDTVGVGHPDLWTCDPFAGDFRDGVIYGRGASDQKGGLASAVYAGKILKEVGISEEITLWVVASVQEEDCEGLCWQYIVKEDQIVPDAVLLTEPTNLGIAVGQRGRLELEVRTEGVSCHGSAPERGENAIYKMAPIIQDVERLNRRLADDPFLGRGSVTISQVRSTAPSLCAVADSATIHLDRRLTRGETIELARREVESLPSVEAAGAKVNLLDYTAASYTGLVYPARAYYPVWTMEETHPLVQMATRTFRTAFGEEPRVNRWAFSTNGVATKGMFGIPTVGFGPGEEVHAHSPMDRVRVDQLVKAMAFYAAFVQSLGGVWSNEDAS